MIKAVIFDVDGTLVDTNDLHTSAWVEAFRHFGREIPYADIRAQMGKGGDQLMPVFLSPEDMARDGDAIASFRGDLFRREYMPRVTAFAGVRPLFERLAASGRTIVLASSGNKDEVESHMTTADIADLVQEATSADDAEHSKPAPDIFEAALRRLAPLSADDAIVVGDTPYDAQAAAKAGLRTIGVLSGGFTEDELRAAGCIAVYRDPEDLLREFDRSLLGA